MPGRQQRRGGEAYDRYVQFSQVPVTALAFLMIPVLLIPLVRPVHGAVAVSFDAADYVIWALFAADYCARFTLTPDRPRFVRTHLFDRAVIGRRGLHYVVGLVIAIMFVAAGLEVAFEAHAKGSTIHSYGGALWWAVVTVTSVGYGDQYPVTVAGRAVAVVLMITGIAL